MEILFEENTERNVEKVMNEEQNEIVVSVVCNAYNHEKYIRDALEGFVMQQTNFRFEVLIHDDASTDRTADIIREYEAKYPEIIKPIYETENQYSKEDGAVSRIQFGRVKGKYIAFCEGDDYWTDPMKLQKQFDALENHPELDICAHGAYIELKGKIYRKSTPSDRETIFTPEEVILGGGSFVMTASLMWRASIENEKPAFRQFLSIDYTIQTHGALRGGMLYLPDIMSVYRMSISGSWTSRIKTNAQERNDFYECMEKMLILMNEDTGKAYETYIKKVILNTRYEFLNNSKRYREMLSKKYRECFTAMSFRRRIKVSVLAYMPWAERLIDYIIKDGI